MAFVYDSATRFNECIIGNLDAIDAALTGILAGAVAIAVFTIEKIIHVATLAERAAIVLLAASIACCAVGYLVGFTSRVSNRDGVRPRAFFGDLTMRPREAMLGAVQALIAASETNLSVRLCKRILAGCAVTFLVAAVVIVAVVQSEGGMVH
jgi:hypothetical protein